VLVATARLCGLAKNVLAAEGIKAAVPRGKKDIPEEPGYLVFFSHRQVVGLAELAVLAATEAAGGAMVIPKAEAKARADAENSVDMALFGRMVAEAVDFNVDAAAQVAHALSVYAVENECDYSMCWSTVGSTPLHVWRRRGGFADREAGERAGGANVVPGPPSVPEPADVPDQPRSCLRELTLSLAKILCRCHSTVRGLMKSRAPISGFERPSPASRAICLSWPVSRLLAGSVLERGCSPVACSSRAAR
jgi:hypothetical protein